MRLALTEVIGQDHVVKALTRAVVRDEMAHSYLFEGPPNVGKTTTGLAFGRALLCESPGGEPCEQCRPCRLTAAGTHPDLRVYRPVISASPQGKPQLWLTAPAHLLVSLLPIDRIRELRNETALRPAFGRRKLILIEEADRMTEDSQNCALKTLEEPAGSTILILTAVNGRTLLPTILSRCQRIPFRRVGAGAIREWLPAGEELSADLDLLSRIADGRPGLALRFGTDESLRQARREIADLVQALLRAHPIDAMRLGESVEGLAEGLWPAEAGVPSYSELKGTDRTRAVRSKSCEVVDWMGSWLRDILLLSVSGPTGRLTNVEDAEWMAEAAQRQGTAWACDALVVLAATRRQLLHNANLKLALDAMFTSLISSRLN